MEGPIEKRMAAAAAAREIEEAVSRAGGTVVKVETPEQTELREWAAENGHTVDETTWRKGGDGRGERPYAAFGCKEHCGGLFVKSRNGRVRAI